ncbi:MAG: PepSY domain-containing protein [Roseitalea sp.]|nr:PepSY domain-containing protein [Roseitalea sp.]MBO6723786.1 PepSY domain-containing protein [Roseitalea sp.]MBO6741926.1 PepSY domain-containing protein [Roseitalea sp.]
MKAPLLAAGIMAATALGAAAPAQAMPMQAMPMKAPLATTAQADIHTIGHRRHYGQRHAMPRRAVIRSLYRRGYRDVHRVHFRNGYWRARALGRRGVVALKIDPRSGHIVRRRLLQPVYHAPRHRQPFHHQSRGGVTFSFGFN